jgi:23S rRNA (guanosine2251-2'-O)-methyltransferase
MKDKKNSLKAEIVYGVHALIEVLKAKKRKLLSIYTTKPLPKSWDRVKQYLPKSIPNIQYVSRDVLDRISGCKDHNNILAWVTPFKYRQKIFDPAQSPYLLMLDSIQDVRNVGAILRSAYCTGVNGVILCKSHGALLTSAAFKASAGLAEHLDIYLVNSTHQAIHELKNSGYNIYVATLGGQSTLITEYKEPLCVIIGNEETGVNKEIKSAGVNIMLPQKVHDISYNASVAAGILLFIISTRLSIIK